MKHEIMERLLKCPRSEGLKFVYLYGSYPRGEITERSDVDICVYYDIDDKKELYHTLYNIIASFPDG